MKKIHWIATGGTISGVGKNRLDLKDYRAGALTAQEMLSHLPEIHDIADITIEQLSNFPSSALNASHWLALRERVKFALSNGSDGVIITHGTNTLEETAYFLHLTVDTSSPVILVGSQRPFTGISSDAQLNLINAVRVASSNEAVGKGVLVVLNEEINCAREVTKTNTYRVEAFQSGQLGLLGYVDSDYGVNFYRQSTRRHTSSSLFCGLDLKELPSVAIVYSHVDSLGTLINRAVLEGADSGIVIAGTGGGHCSSAELVEVEKALEKGIFIVRSSRVGNGRVLQLDRSVWNDCITSDNLLPHKAAILLKLSLCVTRSKVEIQKIFNEH